MKRNFFYPGITALLVAFSVPGFSKNTENNFLQPILNSPGNWFLTLGAGVQFPEWRNPMKVNNGSGFPAPYDNDLYSTKNQSEAVIALAIGRRWQRNDFWFPYSYSLGVFWQYFFRTNLGNTITQYALPEFTNYKYNWQLTSNHIAGLCQA